MTTPEMRQNLLKQYSEAQAAVLRLEGAIQLLNELDQAKEETAPEETTEESTDA